MQEENQIDFNERVPITDDYMFGYVMRQPGICEKVIGCLLPDVKIARIAFKDEPLDTQKTIYGNLGSHSVRLDVYLDDGTTVFNVEMQTGNKANLPKRVRYYGGRIDCDQLSKSQDYNELRPTYVIFICTFDPFGEKRFQYSFENVCAETGQKLNDGSYKLFFNVKGRKGDISPELRALLEYFHNPEKMPESGKTELVRELDGFVDYANQDNDWRRGYMTYMQAQMDARNDGWIQGRIQGKQEGILEGMKQGMAQGMAQGMQKGKMAGKGEQARQTALNLRALGMDVPFIAKATGYPEETVSGWVQEN